eukprot:m.41371 g.41371  ORF g.41371 m.41371 type:complete len:243 (+) comp10491_c0_seq2:102-830(+)
MGFAASLWRPVGYLTIALCVLSLITFAVTAGYGTSCGDLANYDYTSLDSGGFFLFTFVAAFIIELAFIGVHIADISDRLPFNLWGLELGFAVLLAVLAFLASAFFADGIRDFKKNVGPACSVSAAGWEFACVMGFFLSILWIVKSVLLWREYQRSGAGCFDRYRLDSPPLPMTITAMPAAAPAATSASAPGSLLLPPTALGPDISSKSGNGIFVPGHTTETTETRTVMPDGSVLIRTETRTY